MGTPDFAVPSLEILQGAGYDIPAVVTGEDKPRGRGRELSPTPVKIAATKLGLAVLQPASLKDPGFAATVRDLGPDLIVVVAFRILPRELFSIPRFGSFNLHASLLPKYRGAAPIHWAIINGERETGVSTFFLAEKVDTGTLLYQERVPIRDEDDAGSLHDSLALAGAGLVLKTVRAIEQGTAVPVPQDERLATPAPKIFRDDCRIRWNLPALAIRNRIRGLSPFPTAFTVHRDRIIKLYRSALLDLPASAPPGTVSVSDKSLHVHAQDRVLAVTELQQEGKRRMGVEEFLRGYRIASGELLSS